MCVFAGTAGKVGGEVSRADPDPEPAQIGDARDVSTSVACAVAASRAPRLLPTFMPEGDTGFLFQITEE